MPGHPRNIRAAGFSAGFSLTELLVVIAIIAVLIALLMPALARVRQSGQSTQCAANLHTLGQLLFMHANDHDGYLPLAGNIAPGPTGYGTDDPATLQDPGHKRYDYYDNGGGVMCVTALPAALAPYATAAAAPSVSWQAVDAYLQSANPATNLFICPADENTIEQDYIVPRWINNYGSGTFLNGWSSYGINAEVLAWTDNNVGGTTGHSRCRGKLSLVPHPSDTMLMCDTYESIEVWVLGPQLSLGDVYLGTGGTVGNGVFDLDRHQGRMNLLYVDGHVDSQIILRTAAASATGAVGSPGNSPSGALMNVSMDVDFP